MIRQLRIFEIIIIFILAKSLCGKALHKNQNQLNTQKDERVKRGYSHFGGNDFGSAIHVSSGVLQFGAGDEHSISSDSAINIGHSSSLDADLDLSSSISAHNFGSLDSSGHLQSSASIADPWAASGLSSGYGVWLQPFADSYATSAFDASAIPASSITSTHPSSNHIVNTVFSDDSVHSANIELPNSQLHTNIASSSSSSSSIDHSSLDIGSNIHGHGISAISGNIDFNNVADTKHYAKSYGK